MFDTNSVEIWELESKTLQSSRLGLLVGWDAIDTMLVWYGIVGFNVPLDHVKIIVSYRLVLTRNHNRRLVNTRSHWTTLITLDLYSILKLKFKKLEAEVTKLVLDTRFVLVNVVYNILCGHRDVGLHSQNVNVRLYTVYVLTTFSKRLVKLLMLVNNFREYLPLHVFR